MHAIEQPIARSLYAESWLIVWSSWWRAILFAGMVAVFVFGWPWLVAVALPVFVISEGIAIAFAFRVPLSSVRSQVARSGLGAMAFHSKNIISWHRVVDCGRFRYRSPSRVYLPTLRREMQPQDLILVSRLRLCTRSIQQR
jgi:hypothetical protein